MNKSYTSSISTSSSYHSDQQQLLFTTDYDLLNSSQAPLVSAPQLNEFSLQHQTAIFIEPHTNENIQIASIIQSQSNSSFLSKLKGLLIMLVSVLFFDLVRFTMKFSYASAPSLSVIEIGFYRSFGMVILSFLILLASGSVKKAICQVPKRLRFFVFLRSVVGSSEVFFFIAAVSTLTYSTAVVLNFIAPLITPLFAFVFLRQKVKFFDIIALVVSFIGVLIFTNPQILGQSTTSHTEKGKSNTAIGFVFGILTALTLALDMIILRKIAALNSYQMEKHSHQLLPPAQISQSNQYKRPESLHPMTPVFYVFVLGSIIQGTLYLIETLTAKQSSSHETPNYFQLFIYLLLSALSGITAQFLQSLATRYQKASKLAVMFFFQVVMGFLFQSTIFHGKIGAAQILGTLMILGSSLTVAIMKICLEQKSDIESNGSNFQKI